MRRQSEKERRTLMAVRGGMSCPLPAGPGSRPAPPTPSPVREVRAEDLGRGKAQDQDTPKTWEELREDQREDKKGRAEQKRAKKERRPRRSRAKHSARASDEEKLAEACSHVMTRQAVQASFLQACLLCGETEDR